MSAIENIDYNITRLVISTYTLVEFSPVLVRTGICPTLVLGVHTNFGL